VQKTPRKFSVPEPNPAPPVDELQPPTGDVDIARDVRELVQRWGVDHSPELVEEMIGTVLRMARDRLSIADLKLYNRSLKELRYAARMWQPYAALRKITIFGSARTQADAPAARAAFEFARQMREAGYMIITGGGDGIMGAAQLGAGRDHSFGLNIRLPFEQSPNVTIEGDPKLVNFNYFFTRKLNFMKESHALALFPGGLGTLDEGFEALTLLQTGKAKLIPVVMVDEPGGDYWKSWCQFMREKLLKNGLISANDFDLFKVTEDVHAAVGEVLKFYRNYQSSRYVGQQMIVRLARRLTEAALARLQEAFSDLLRTGRFVQGVALRQEKNEPEISHLPRLIFTPRRNDFGRLRRLIDAINEAEVEDTPPDAQQPATPPVSARS
jgi:uncharacterized protein (TIGR00730 family)